MYGFTLAAATLVPLQGFWNCYVYCRPRYFKKVKIFSIASRIISGLSFLRSRRSTEQDSDQTDFQMRVATEATRNGTTDVASSVKPAVANQSSAAIDSDVVTVVAPDPDKLGAPDLDKPEVICYEATDPNDGSGFHEDNSDIETHDADDKSPVPDGKGDEKEDEVARFEMILAG